MRTSNPVKTVGLVFITAAALVWPAVAAFGFMSGPDAPKEPTACETFAKITPGFYEAMQDTETLSDPDSTTSARIRALSRQLDAQAGKGRTQPYSCDNPVDKVWFNKYVAK